MTTLGPFIPSEGLSGYSEFSIPPSQASTLSDCYANFGTIVNRGNVTALNSALASTPTITGVGHYTDPAQIGSGANNTLVVVVSGTGAAAKKVYTALMPSSSAITFNDRTGALALSNTVSEPWQFDSLNGVFLGVGNSTDSDTPIQLSPYTANAAVLAGSPPYASCIKVVNNFCFLGRNLSSSSLLSRVYWSSIGDPQVWPAANFVDVRINDGSAVTALASIGQDLIIFKRTSISRLGTTTTSVAGAVTLGPLSTVSDKIGCAGPGYAKNLPDGRVAFVDQYARLQIYDGSSITNVSERPYPKPNVSTVGYSGGTFIALGGIAIDPYRHSIFLLQGTGTLTYNLSYDYLQGSWNLNRFSDTTRRLLSIDVVGEAFTVSDPLVSLVIAGDNAGVLWLLNGSSGPNTVTGTSIAPQVRMSLALPEGFVPRTLMIPATLESGCTLAVTYGFNGTVDSTATQITRSTTPKWNLFSLTAKTSNLPRPSMLQIVITPTAGKTFTIFPFFISDEILSNVR